jgi:AcrR family transcriptional regulator
LITERSLGKRCPLSSKEIILSKAIILFAEKGYSALSMRALAKEVNMSVAGIYHYFPDKNTLYLETVRFAFSGKALATSKILESDLTVQEKLENYVRLLLNMMSHDPIFHQLMQREIMEANTERMQLLAQGVFKNHFDELLAFARELAPHLDAYLVATSIIGLVKYYLDNQPILPHLPGWDVKYQDVEVLAKHITQLLLFGIFSPQGALV